MQRALQLAGAVFIAGAVLQEELSGASRDVDAKSAVAEAIVDVLLEIVQMLIENLRQRFGGERAIRDYCVETIDEFRRKLFTNGIQTDTLQLGVHVFAILWHDRLIAEARVQLAPHRAGA